MKKYLVVFAGISLIAGSMTLVNLTKAEEEESSAVDSIAEAIAPIIRGVSDNDLRQELSIKEIQGRTVCRGLGVCPPAATLPILEVLIKAAKVTEIASSSLLNVSIFNYNYKIDTSGSKIVRQTWGGSNIDEFSVGDIVNVFGSLDVNDSYLIHAQTVRNVSLQKSIDVFKGVIDSIDATSTTFILNTGAPTDVPIFLPRALTVVVTSDTRIILEGRNIIVCVKAPCPTFQVKTFSDLKVGTKVIVRGLLDKANSKIQAKEIVVSGGENVIRPFFKAKPQKIEGQIQKFTEKLESKIEKGAGQSADAIRNKIEEIQKKIAEILNQLKGATTATSTSQ